MSFNKDELWAVEFIGHNSNSALNIKWVYENSAEDDVTIDGFFNGSIVNTDDVIVTPSLRLSVVESIDIVKVEVRNQTISETGSQRLPSNLIMKWGMATEAGEVVFDTPFPNSCVNVTLTSKSVEGSDPANHTVLDGSVNTNSFTAQTAGTGTDSGFYWVAMGD